MFQWNYSITNLQYLKKDSFSFHLILKCNKSKKKNTIVQQYGSYSFEKVKITFCLSGFRTAEILFTNCVVVENP